MATPLVGALLGLLVQLLVHFTPWFAASLRSGAVRTLTSVVLPLGGALMVGVAEAVGVPLTLAACIAWSRADTARAAAIDAELDAAERRKPAPAAVVPVAGCEAVDGEITVHSAR